MPLVMEGEGLELLLFPSCADAPIAVLSSLELKFG